jgi:CDP-glucose 4,6-dehydratase
VSAPSPEFWRGKRVLLTGHTGFKGSWLMLWLQALGADVHGMALAPDTVPSLFEQLFESDTPGHFIGDIREVDTMRTRVTAVRPDVILHLAAQPLVLRSYRDPLETWQTNVMGTAHLLDALKEVDRQMAVVIVTTDKVYENREWLHGYRETDALGGHDPYSASKAGCELVVASYRASFFAHSPVRIASARAGNVIGGGDWAENRIVPDLMRALAKGEALNLRNPGATRPWQHVLDPLAGYLRLAERLWDDAALARAFNFGPGPADQRSVRDLVEVALHHWPGRWQDASDSQAPHEAGRLMLATDLAHAALGWEPVWRFEEAVAHTVDWYRRVHEGEAPRALCEEQIAGFEEAAR